MVGSLGDGFRAIQAVALKEHPSLSEAAPWKEKLFDELSYEAQKFVIYRSWKMREREYVSLHRIRSLCKLIRPRSA